MDQEIFDGIYFSNAKFLNLIKSQESIPEIIEIIKYKVKNLDTEQCTIDNLFLIKQNHQFLIEKGIEKEQSIYDYFDKLIHLFSGIIWLIIGYYKGHVDNYAMLIIADAEKAKTIATPLFESVKSFVSLIIIAGGIIGFIYLIIYCLHMLGAKKDRKYKEKLRIAYSILEKCFEEKIQELKK